MHRRQLLSIVAGIVVALSIGCSRIEIGYRYLDWLVGQYVERYVDLTGEQRRIVSQEIDTLKHRHCREFFPRIVQLLGDIKNDLQSATPSVKRVRWYSDVIEYEIGELVFQASPGIAKLMASLTDAQVRELLSKLEKGNRRFIERFEAATQEELADDYRISSTRNLERWLGKLSGEQLVIVKDWSQVFEPLGYEGLAVRLAWQEELADLLVERRQPIEFFIPKVGVFLERRRDDPSGRYRQRLERNKLESVAMVTSILAHADDVQRKYMRREIGILQDDIRSLVCS